MAKHPLTQPLVNRLAIVFRQVAGVLSESALLLLLHQLLDASDSLLWVLNIEQGRSFGCIETGQPAGVSRRRFTELSTTGIGGDCRMNLAEVLLFGRR